MNNLREIEKFDSAFKNAAIDFELPFNEEAWDFMEQKLNSEHKQKKKIGFWKWLFLLIIVTASGAYLVFKNNAPISQQQTNNEIALDLNKNSNKSNKENIIKENPIVKENETVQVNSTSKSNKVNLTKNNLINPSVKTNSKIKSNEDRKPINDLKSNTVKTLNQSTTHSNSTKINNDINAKSGIQIPKNVPNKQSSVKPGLVNDKVADDINYISSLVDSKTTENYYTSTNLPMHNHYILDLDKAAKENKTAINTRATELEREAIAREKAEACHCEFLTARRNVPTSNWYVTALIGNNIGYVSNPRLDLSAPQFQFAIGYNISKYLSIQTGVLVGQKSFSVKKDQYLYPITPSSSAKFFKRASADVSVIDIPINLKYQFSDRENNGLYVIAGFSTLFMPKENYVLTIDHNGTIYTKQQNFSNTQSILGLMNFALGYQLPINKNFVFITEPYIQLPIQDIGNGGTKMCSVGLQLGARYNFNKRKK